MRTSKHYRCQRALLLGAVYDTLDRLHWSLMESSSQRGVFRARNTPRGKGLTIRLDSVQTAPCFQISVDPESTADSNAEQFLKALAETLDGICPAAAIHKEVETCEED